jgi:hypothetical protein
MIANLPAMMTSLESSAMATGWTVFQYPVVSSLIVFSFKSQEKISVGVASGSQFFDWPLTFHHYTKITQIHTCCFSTTCPSHQFLNLLNAPPKPGILTMKCKNQMTCCM